MQKATRVIGWLLSVGVSPVKDPYSKARLV